MDHFPNLPRDPAPPVQSAPPAATVATAARAARPAKLMYVWIGLALVAFGGIAYWGMLRPSPTGADAAARDPYIPEAKTAAERAEEDRLAAMVKRLRAQEASRIIVLDGLRSTAESKAPDQKAAPAKSGNDMIIRFTPATQPSTPTTIGGRTKPFLAPDVAEDGSFFGQIDTATGKPKTVYSSNLGKYIVDYDSAAAPADRPATPSADARP